MSQTRYTGRPRREADEIMRLVNAVEQALTDKHLGPAPSNPKVPLATFVIQPAPDATCNRRARPFPAVPKDHPEDSTLSILFGGQMQFRSAGRAQARTWAMDLSAGTTYKENGCPVGCKQQHQHKGWLDEGCFGDWSKRAPRGYIQVEYAVCRHKMPLWIRLM